MRLLEQRFMNQGIEVRMAQKEDLDQILVLCKEHATYEDSEYDETGTSIQLASCLIRNQPTLVCWVATCDRRIVGYTTFMKQFSTWGAGFYVYMDCLFVKDGFRNQGIGRQLFKQVKNFARSAKCPEIQWQTPIENIRAIKFYEREGATVKQKARCFYCL